MEKREESKEQRAESREQRAESREQKRGKKQAKCEISRSTQRETKQNLSAASPKQPSHCATSTSLAVRGGQPHADSVAAESLSCDNGSMPSEQSTHTLMMARRSSAVERARALATPRAAVTIAAVAAGRVYL